MFIVDGKNYINKFRGTTEPIWQAGQEVQILYNPNMPKFSIFPDEYEKYISRFTTGHIALVVFISIIWIVLTACIGVSMDKKRLKIALEKHMNNETDYIPQEK